MDWCLILILVLVVIGLAVYKEKFTQTFVITDLGSNLQLEKKAQIQADIKTNNRQKLSEDILVLNNLVEAVGLRVRYSDNEFGIWSFNNINKEWSLYRLRFSGVVSSEPDSRFGVPYDSNFGKEVYHSLGFLKGLWVQNVKSHSWVYLEVISLEFLDIDLPPFDDMTSFCYWDIFDQVPAIHKICFENNRVVQKVWQSKHWLTL